MIKHACCHIPPHTPGPESIFRKVKRILIVIIIFTHSKVIKLFPHQSNPEDNIFINKTVEVLIEEEEAGPDEGCVTEMKLAPGHVSDLGNRKHVLREKPAQMRQLNYFSNHVKSKSCDQFQEVKKIEYIHT